MIEICDWSGGKGLGIGLELVHKKINDFSKKHCIKNSNVVHIAQNSWFSVKNYIFS